MANGHGGARPGAGRPKKDRSDGGKYDDPLSYLMAVSTGDEEPDALRIQAAKAALPYVSAKQRAPMAGKTPRQMQRADDDIKAAVSMADWLQKQSELADRHGRG